MVFRGADSTWSVFSVSERHLRYAISHLIPQPDSATTIKHARFTTDIVRMHLDPCRTAPLFTACCTYGSHASEHRDIPFLGLKSVSALRYGGILVSNIDTSYRFPIRPQLWYGFSGELTLPHSSDAPFSLFDVTLTLLCLYWSISTLHASKMLAATFFASVMVWASILPCKGSEFSRVPSTILALIDQHPSVTSS